MKKIIAVLLLAAFAAPAGAANLTAVSATVNDVTGAVRATFTSGERLTLRQAVNVGVTSPSGGQISFTFTIKGPDGATRFTHTGNQAPGTAGGAQSQLAGISIASFYSTPGQYTFVPGAVLDGAPANFLALGPYPAFTISSPNIGLIYPPNGATGLSDSPLTFRWVASGATRYRITVADNASLYNPAYTEVNAGESYYPYPVNPSEERARLVADKVYYWKIEGLDAANNTISQSTIYSFSLKQQATSQARNVAITALNLATAVSDYSLPMSFNAVLTNTGASTESGLSVRMTLGGIGAQESPKPVASIGAGESQTLSFTAYMPADQQQSLAVACTDLFDDNVPDNCKTALISRNAGTSGSSGAAGTNSTSLSYDEMFQAILKQLGPDAAAALQGYTFSSLSCANCSQSELYDIISALLKGDATLVDAAVTDTASGAPAAAAAPGAAAKTETAEASSETMELAEEKPAGLEEWSGYTEARSDKAPATFIITSRKEWRKLWKTISAEDEPEVDFDAKMVVGIVAGSGDMADQVRLMGQRKTEDGLVFDYYVIAAQARPQAAAYVFKVYPRSEEKIGFNRLDVSK